ncbi:MAG: hypothetical protein SFU99_16340 [Saprospiraceae bacterium]|nr:hypothetical protein [Saprospiraceae bacterium]
MKKITFIVILLSIHVKGLGQILNQDANGKSSIIWQGTTVGLDLPEGLIKFSHYSSSTDTTGIIWGIDAQGANKSGVAELFNKGKFTPNTIISGLIGQHKTIYIKDEGYMRLENELDSLVNYRNILIMEVDSIYKNFISSIIIGCNPTSVSQEVIILKEKLKNIESRKDLSNKILETFFSSDIKSCDKEIYDQIKELSNLVDNNSKIAELVKIDKRIAFLTPDHLENTKVQNNRTIWYSRIGVETLEFKFDHGSSSNVVTERFMDTLQIAAFLELGITYQFRKNFLGISLGFLRTNNFSSLTKNEYNFTQRDSLITGGVFQKSEIITAYSGIYNKFWQAQINFDFLHFIKLDENNYYAIGPFLRINLPFNEKIAKAHTVLGINASLINGRSGSFLGGLYIQTDDLWGNQENIFSKTIRFGLNTRFSLGRIFPKEIN